MPIDLVIDEREGPKPEVLGPGDSNNNASAVAAGRASADTTHTDGASTPDVVSTLRLFFSLLLGYGNMIDYCVSFLPVLKEA